MTLNRKRTIAYVRIAGGLLACALAAPIAHTQGLTQAKPMTRTERTDLREAAPLTTFYLKNARQPNDGDEILTGLRLMLDPGVKLYLVPSQNAIVLKALPEELAAASKLIGELDLPRKEYRLTYTLTEVDGGKRMTSQHITLAATAGQRVVLKQGSKIPVVTGSYQPSEKTAETQMTYLDVGMNFDATLNATANGAEIKSKIERSSVAAEKPSPGDPQDPSIRQTLIEGVSFLPLGRQVMLGAIDIPESTRHLEIEVKLELAP